MKRIQCTFRLPENVVELIDSQSGDTRTDKLLCLLREVSGELDDGVMRGVIGSALQERMDKMEQRIERLENSRKPTKAGINSSNIERKEKSIQRIKHELSTLSSEQIAEIRSARYPLSVVRSYTCITKSQCDSYGKMIREIVGA